MGDTRILIEQANHGDNGLVWWTISGPYADLVEALEMVAELERTMPSRILRVRAEGNDDE